MTRTTALHWMSRADQYKIQLQLRRYFAKHLNGQGTSPINGHYEQLKKQATENVNATNSVSTNDTTRSTAFKRGVLLDHSIDLQSVRPGDQLDIPYEMTLSESLQDFWHSAFFDLSRMHSSRPFCRKMGLQDKVIPFSLALFLTSSMTHADAAKVQVGFGKVSYQWPLFAGDTVHKRFTVQKIRSTSDGNHSIIHFICDLYNQRDRLCMRADKSMLFPFHIPASETIATPSGSETKSSSKISDIDERYLFRNHLVNKATTVLADQPSQSLARLEPGMLILHRMQRSLTFSQSQQLASLARLTHAKHFDTRKYDRSTEILIPGALVLGLALSESARDLHEILYEEIQSCNYLNSLHPENIIGAISYVEHVDESLPGGLEVATVCTLGIKNLTVAHELKDVDIPQSLFEPGLYTRDIEQICKKSCPVLSGKIVVQVQRKILRQSVQQDVFLL